MENEKSIIIIGDRQAGKTSLLYAIDGYNFLADQDSTHGFDVHKSNGFGTRIYEFDELNLKNTISTVKKVDPIAAIIVVSSENSNIYDSINKWAFELENAKIRNDIKKIIAITKTDLTNITEPIDINRINLKYNFDNIIQTSIKEKIGIQEIRDTIDELIISPEKEFNEVDIIINEMAAGLCKLVANNPNALTSIEWRDLERIVAEALKGIGFTVELTPPSKDGGKDVIASCIIESKIKKYYIEIKHWNTPNKVGNKDIIDFIEITLSENIDGGLYISSSGYTQSVHKNLSQFMKQKIRLGEQEKIISLCKQYKRKLDGIWCPKTILPEVLYEDTLIN